MRARPFPTSATAAPRTATAMAMLTPHEIGFSQWPARYLSEERPTYADRVERAIVGFHLDAQGEWVAELACGHRQHVRHRPPFYPRPWVLEAETRQQRLGAPLECRLCDQDVPATEAGGEAACFAHLVCPDCGVVLDGSAHRPGCTAEA
jgi:Protein of unknown function (DUF3565)